MVSSISSGSAHRTELSTSAQDQISTILKSIKTLRKKVALLQKQLMNAPDPATRLQLAKEIEDLQRTIQLLERQIAQIEEAEQRRAKVRQEARHAMAAESAAADQHGKPKI
ncbi:FlxA-like family protein [Duganella sp. S19_KUP01_CR8]|uniref:FlxA-like family protein n=1 Tax=Duganella sp. S19_KUP01_CR8 TaxID=3025502 RepID=UPI002FCDC3C6